MRKWVDEATDRPMPWALSHFHDHPGFYSPSGCFPAVLKNYPKKIKISLEFTVKNDYIRFQY